MNRRGFLGCLAGLVAAPMIVKLDAIMPVKVMKPLFPEMAVTIEKITVEARSRMLKANWTMELAEDLKSVYGIDEAEFARIVNEEIMKEIHVRHLQFRQSGNSRVLRPETFVISTSNRSWFEDDMSRFHLCGASLRTDRIL